MTESSQLIAVIKKQMKHQGMTYRDLALKLDISEPSVKRIMSSSRMTIDRLVQISNIVGFTLAEVSKLADVEQPRLNTLTEKQEKEVVSDQKLLIVAVCALNHWSLEEITEYYNISKPECISYLLKLTSLRIIDLLPNNRIRTIVARDFDWLPFGPIRRYFIEHGMQEFLTSNFSVEGEAMTFVHGMFTDQALAQIQEEMRRIKKKFAELHEESLAAPLSKRSGIGFLMALRGWEPIVFTKLRR
jgi:transcriptional regulator with XRE-family HTH domain